MTATADQGLGGTFPLAGRPIPRMGYGMGQLARTVEAGGDRNSAIALLRQAHELGIRHFDTAEFYGNGLANALLAEAFGDGAGDILVATKVGARPDPGAAVPLAAAQRPAELRDAVEANLRSLRTDHLDLVNLRRMDTRPGLVVEGDQRVPLDDQLAELISLRDAGTLTAIGVSHVSVEQVQAASGAGIACVQNMYHLLDRSSEPVLDVCSRSGVAWVPYYPLGGGNRVFPTPRVVDDPRVRAVADELGVTPTQVGLAWHLAHAPNAMLIPGTGSAEHLVENTAAGAVDLDAAIMDRLS